MNAGITQQLIDFLAGIGIGIEVREGE